MVRQPGPRVPGGTARPLAGDREDPTLRTRAAEFERTTAGWSPTPSPQGGAALGPADQVVVNAYLSAYTLGMLAWADGNGERKLEEVIDEAFDALQRTERTRSAHLRAARSSTTVTSGVAPTRIGGPQ